MQRNLSDSSKAGTVYNLEGHFKPRCPSCCDVLVSMSNQHRLSMLEIVISIVIFLFSMLEENPN